MVIWGDLEMLCIQFKECCEDCPNIDINVDKMEITTNSYEQTAYTISCKHQNVCKYYLEQSESKLLVKSM